VAPGSARSGGLGTAPLWLGELAWATHDRLVRRALVTTPALLYNLLMHEPSPVRDSDVCCARCGYNLTGVSIGGACPECGTPVNAAFQRGRVAPTSGKAVAALVLGIGSVPACVLAGVPAMVIGGLAIALGIAANREARYPGRVAPGASGMAATGIVLGGLGLLCGALFLLGLVLE